MVRGVACIRDVGCAHPGFAPYLARICCPKVRCVHPSKWPFWLHTSVFQKTLACIRFRNDPCVHPFSNHLKPPFGSEHPIIWFLLPSVHNSRRVPLSNLCQWGVIQSTGTIPHAIWTLTVSAFRAILCCKNPYCCTSVNTRSESRVWHACYRHNCEKDTYKGSAFEWLVSRQGSRQCVAVCCSVVQCVAVLQCVAMCWSALRKADMYHVHWNKQQKRKSARCRDGSVRDALDSNIF